MSSRMAPSPIPMTDDNRRQLELWCNTLNRKLMENPIEDISNYALMALLREKYDPGRVIDALLEGMCTLCFDIFFLYSISFHYLSYQFFQNTTHLTLKIPERFPKIFSKLVIQGKKIYVCVLLMS